MRKQSTRSRSTLPLGALMVRQGDVLLVRVDRLPKSVKPVQRQRGRIVLAEGETTGHAHAILEKAATLYTIDDRAAMQRAAEELLASVGLKTEIRQDEVIGFLGLEDEATVTHEEHGMIPLTGSAYVALRQREYAPEAIRQVAD